MVEMARKKTITKQKKSFFSFGKKAEPKKTTTKSRRKKPNAKPEAKLGRKGFLIMFAWLIFFGGIGTGFFYLEKYVRGYVFTDERNEGELVLYGKPAWASNELIARILDTSRIGDGPLRLDEESAARVQLNLKDKMEWLDDIFVQTTSDGIKIYAKFRKPVVMVNHRNLKLYVDTNLVPLKYLPVPVINTVEIRGVRAIREPEPGIVWRQDDLAAGLRLVEVLNNMDSKNEDARPLLREIDYIDVSNFDGRRDARKSHIVLYAKDGTDIQWGASLGSAAKNFEAGDPEKLGKLYSFYKQYGTLQGVVKYIDLRNPQSRIPQP